MFETALVARLGELAPNMYPLAAPKPFSTPAVIYNRLMTEPVNDLEGNPTSAVIHLQIDVYDPSLGTAKALATSIRQNLVEWTDDDVQAVSWTGEDDWIDQTTEVSLYRTRLTFLVFASA